LPAVILEEKRSSDRPEPALTYALILKLYVPLALSWVFMALEGPSVTAIIGRLPHRELNSAAMLVLFSIAMWVESPVIDLLSTATTLAKNRQHYAQLSRYVWYLIAWVTVAHAVVVFTPVYNLLALRVLSLPPNVAAQARLGLALMVPWSGFIGWRRYLQGILIRFHQTRLISIGTFTRVTTISIVGWSLFAFSKMPSIVIAGTALTTAVAMESIFIHFASRATVRREFSTETPPDAADDMGYAPSGIAETALTSAAIPDAVPKNDGYLTFRKLLSFHMPLAATTVVALIGGPLISAALSNSKEPVLSLASWQVVSTLVWLCRTIEFALPEVIITLYKDAKSAAMLRQFSIRVGLTISGAMLLMAVTGGDRLFFGKILGESDATVAMAHLAFCCTITLPLIGCQQNYIKGMLTAHHLTTARFMSSLVSFTTLIAMLIIGVKLGWTGVVNAAVALNVAILGEVLVLFTFWRRGVKRLGIQL
jgi:progressive ankylosis protein